MSQSKPFIEQPEALVDVEMIELVVVIDQGLVDLLPAPQNQQNLVFDHDVQLVVWGTKARARRPTITPFWF